MIQNLFYFKLIKDVKEREEKAELENIYLN
jgi:hypothetical protein